MVGSNLFYVRLLHFSKNFWRGLLVGKDFIIHSTEATWFVSVQLGGIPLLNGSLHIIHEPRSKELYRNKPGIIVHKYLQFS